MSFRKNESPEQQQASAAPLRAGAPKVTVRKDWAIGSLHVSSENGRVWINRVQNISVSQAVLITPEECAALADVLLQAAP